MDPNSPNQPQNPEQAQIGAGLQESRINTEFVDFLRKYSSHALFAIAAVLLIYWLVTTVNERRASAVDEAFMTVNRAVTNQNTSVLLALAEEHAGVRSVPHVARLQAANTILREATLGMVDPGQPTARVLTPEEQAERFDRAEGAYRAVLEQTESKQDRTLFAVQALWGLSTIAMSQQEFDAAREHLNKAKSLAERANVGSLAGAIEDRMAALEELSTVAAIVPTDEELQALQNPGQVTPGFQQSPAVQGAGMGANRDGTGEFDIDAILEGMQLQNNKPDAPASSPGEQAPEQAPGEMGPPAPAQPEGEAQSVDEGGPASADPSDADE